MGLSSFGPFAASKEQNVVNRLASVAFLKGAATVDWDPGLENLRTEDFGRYEQDEWELGQPGERKVLDKADAAITELHRAYLGFGGDMDEMDNTMRVIGIAAYMGGDERKGGRNKVVKSLRALVRTLLDGYPNAAVLGKIGGVWKWRVSKTERVEGECSVGQAVWIGYSGRV